MVLLPEKLTHTHTQISHTYACKFQHTHTQGNEMVLLPEKLSHTEQPLVVADRGSWGGIERSYHSSSYEDEWGYGYEEDSQQQIVSVTDLQDDVLDLSTRMVRVFMCVFALVCMCVSELLNAKNAVLLNGTFKYASTVHCSHMLRCVALCPACPKPLCTSCSSCGQAGRGEWQFNQWLTESGLRATACASAGWCLRIRQGADLKLIITLHISYHRRAVERGHTARQHCTHTTLHRAWRGWKCHSEHRQYKLSRG